MKKKQFDKVMKQAREWSSNGISKVLIRDLFNVSGVILSNEMLENFIVHSKMNNIQGE